MRSACTTCCIPWSLSGEFHDLPSATSVFVLDYSTVALEEHDSYRKFGPINYSVRVNRYHKCRFIIMTEAEDKAREEKLAAAKKRV